MIPLTPGETIVLLFAICVVSALGCGWKGVR